MVRGKILTARLNGVPLRRVSQAYVIATSTKVDISSISIPESVNDSYFAKSKATKSTKEGEFFGEGKEKKAFPEEKKSEQKVSVSNADEHLSDQLTHRPLMPQSLRPSRRLRTWANTSRPLGDCQRVTDSTSLSSNWDLSMTCMYDGFRLQIRCPSLIH